MDYFRVQSDRPTTRKRRTGSLDEARSPEEEARMLRGQELKRYVRAAAALHGMFNDADLARAVNMSRMAVEAWWAGAQPSPQTIGRLALTTGLSRAELTDFVHHDGPPPRIVWPGSPADEAIREGIRRDRDDRQP
jgi:hypothetical protein